jgi:hypothetical protein
MLVLSVRSQTAREVHFRSFVDAHREVQVVDPASIHWVGPGTFRGLLAVHCNGFEVRGCEGPAEERVLRRVSFVVTVSTPQVQVRYP